MTFFISIFTYNFIASAFEFWAHLKLSTGGEFSVRNLNTNVINKLTLNYLFLDSFKNKNNNLENLKYESNTYYKLNEKYTETIGSFGTPNKLFLMTTQISKKYFFLSRKIINKLNKTEGSENIDLYLVVPDDLSDNITFGFKDSDSNVLKLQPNIKTWVLTIDKSIPSRILSRKYSTYTRIFKTSVFKYLKTF